jgi:hypothetical protein
MTTAQVRAGRPQRFRRRFVCAHPRGGLAGEAQPIGDVMKIRYYPFAVASTHGTRMSTRTVTATWTSLPLAGCCKRVGL